MDLLPPSSALGGGSMFLRKLNVYLPDYTAYSSRRPQYLELLPGETRHVLSNAINIGGG
jgi:hypothetical protein